MSDEMLTILAFLVTLAGMAAFALSNDAHWRQLLGPRPQASSVRSGCKIGGAALLAVSFLLCTLADPISMAILVWPMLLGVAAACVAAFLTVHARGARQA